jgi:uncharacterized protein involved in tolerance to divalent cations
MFKKYYQAWISATSREEAEKILELLLAKHLVAGGLITQGFSHHWWQGKIDREPYWQISTFTIKKHCQLIIQAVKSISRDETPVVAFHRIDQGNSDFFHWIKENTK